MAIVCSLSLTGWFLNTLGSLNHITLVYRFVMSLALVMRNPSLGVHVEKSR